ncbi:AaceriABL137Wp [[Ashbya] aceris (nom. inval.)]|nr:AaceriABL137Wp [[Ashbya] aceris (nom. inval.)]
MVKFTYRDACTVGSALIVSATAFIMGVFFANQTYDYHLLFNANMTQEHYDNALRHYQTLYFTAQPVLYVFGAIAMIGLIGSLIRIYKPNPELQLFEYGSLAMYVLGVCVFLTNIKTGVNSAHYGNWGEVTQNQGLAVIASSNIILLVVFVGVLVLQSGLWYSEWEYAQRLETFMAEQEAENAAAPKEAAKGGKKSTKSKKE